MGRVGAVIVAVGKSRRMGGADKIFAKIAGRPLLAHSVVAFEGCGSVDEIVVVVGEASLEKARRLAETYHWTKVSAVCCGGAERQDSVKAGLERLSECEWVIIHDGARPCVTVDLIEAGLKKAKEYGAAIAAVPVSDTLKAVAPDLCIRETLHREQLWAAQTPQVFRLDIIEEAYRQAQDYVTDDSTLVENACSPVMVYPGRSTNIKVTTPEDLFLAEAVLNSRKEG